jgi:hypothetical protein
MEWPNLDCTDPPCCIYLAPPGTRWSYTTRPNPLEGVIEFATGIGLKTSSSPASPSPPVSGLYVQVGYKTC